MILKYYCYVATSVLIFCGFISLQCLCNVALQFAMLQRCCNITAMNCAVWDTLHSMFDFLVTPTCRVWCAARLS